MLTIPGTAKIFLCNSPTNMKKSFAGLSLVIEQLFPNELLSGAFFVFLNRQRDHMKILFWDQDGFVIWFKRLERGTFLYKWGEASSIDRRQFFLILEGIIPKRIQPRFSL